MWCELLSETLAALWSGSVTSDPERWLKWSPLSVEEDTKKRFRSLLGPSDTVRVCGCGQKKKKKTQLAAFILEMLCSILCRVQAC